MCLASSNDDVVAFYLNTSMRSSLQLRTLHRDIYYPHASHIAQKVRGKLWDQDKYVPLASHFFRNDIQVVFGGS
jgi:hypothetical protein